MNAVDMSRPATMSDSLRPSAAPAASGTDAAPFLSRPARIGILIAATLLVLLAALLLPALPQPVDYHGFADSRPILGISNFWNVASNLAFLAPGVAGGLFLFTDPRRHAAFRDPAERWPYVVLFAGVVLTCFGS